MAKPRRNRPPTKMKLKTTADVPAEAETAITNAEVAEKKSTRKKPASQPLPRPASAAPKLQKLLKKRPPRKSAKPPRPTATLKKLKSRSRSTTRPAHAWSARARTSARLPNSVDKDKVYGLEDALELATKTSPVKFDATVELHVNLRVDPRHADQNIRDNFVLATRYW
jgi:hypothetical protein